MTKLRIILLMMLATLVWPAIMAADFNPANPPEPDDIYVYKHNIRVTATPEGKGYTTGTGRYAEGSTVTISTSSAVANWQFKHWLKDGELDTQHTSSSFRYTMGTQDIEFTAVYEYVEPQDPGYPGGGGQPTLPPFDPANPDEPETPVFPDKPIDPPQPPETPKFTLGIVSNPFAACSFSIGSGLAYEAGTVVTVTTYGNQGFQFIGWFDDNNILLSETTTITYTIPEADTTLTAKWIFNPDDNPDDPESNQSNVSNSIYGDITGDRLVDVADLQRMLNIIAGIYIPTANDHSGDLTNDNITDVADLQRIINTISK